MLPPRHSIEDVSRLVAVARKSTALAMEYWKTCIDLHGALDEKQIGLTYVSTRRCLQYAVDSSITARTYSAFVGDGNRIQLAKTCLDKGVVSQLTSLLQASPKSWGETETYAHDVIAFVERELQFSPDAIALGDAAEGYWARGARDLRTEHAQRFMGALGLAGQLAARFDINPTQRPAGEWVHYLQSDRQKADAAARRTL